MENPLVAKQLETVTKLREKLEEEEMALIVLMRLFKSQQGQAHVTQES